MNNIVQSYRCSTCGTPEGNLHALDCGQLKQAQYIPAPDAEQYDPSDTSAARMEARLCRMEEEIRQLRVEADSSNAWAGRWAQEQANLGVLLKNMQEQLLTGQEKDTIMAGLETLKAFLKD